MVVGVRSRCCQQCVPCSGDFRKVVDLPYSGLVIYVHTKSEDQNERALENNEGLILHNTTSKDLNKPHYISELCQYKTKYNQIKIIIKRVRCLLDEIVVIKGNQVIGICDHCKKAKTTKQCKKCDYMVSEFLADKRKRIEEKQKRFKEWLLKVKNLLQSILNAQSVCKHMVYKDAELERILKELKTPLSLRTPDIDFFPNIENDQCMIQSITESKEMLEQLLSKIKSDSVNDKPLASDDSLYPSPSDYSETCICKLVKEGHFLKNEIPSLSADKSISEKDLKGQSEILLQKLLDMKRTLILDAFKNADKALIESLLNSINSAYSEGLVPTVTKNLMCQLTALGKVLTPEEKKGRNKNLIDSLLVDLKRHVIMEEGVSKHLLEALSKVCKKTADQLAKEAEIARAKGQSQKHLPKMTPQLIKSRQRTSVGEKDAPSGQFKETLPKLKDDTKDIKKALPTASAQYSGVSKEEIKEGKTPPSRDNTSILLKDKRNEIKKALPKGRDTDPLKYKQKESDKALLKGRDAELSKHKQKDTDKALPKGRDAETSKYKQKETDKALPKGRDAEIPKYKQKETDKALPKGRDAEPPKYKQKETDKALPKGRDAETPKYKQKETDKALPKGRDAETPKYKQKETDKALPKGRDVETPKYKQKETDKALPKGRDAETPTYKQKETDKALPKGRDAETPKYKQKETDKALPKGRDAEPPKYKQKETDKALPKGRDAETHKNKQKEKDVSYKDEVKETGRDAKNDELLRQQVLELGRALAQGLSQALDRNAVRDISNNLRQAILKDSRNLTKGIISALADVCKVLSKGIPKNLNKQLVVDILEDMNLIFAAGLSSDKNKENLQEKLRELENALTQTLTKDMSKTVTTGSKTKTPTLVDLTSVSKGKTGVSSKDVPSKTVAKEKGVVHEQKKPDLTQYAEEARKKILQNADRAKARKEMDHVSKKEGKQLKEENRQPGAEFGTRKKDTPTKSDIFFQKLLQERKKEKSKDLQSKRHITDLDSKRLDSKRLKTISALPTITKKLVDTSTSTDTSKSFIYGPLVSEDTKYIVIGTSLEPYIPHHKVTMKQMGHPPLFFKKDVVLSELKDMETVTFKDISKGKMAVFNAGVGVIRYKLSDREFIDKGWTKLPTRKIMRKMNIYKMNPAYPQYDWFKRNQEKKVMFYDTGERLAEIDDDGRGKWYYKNGSVALEYYNSEDMLVGQRYIVYSSGEECENGRRRPTTVLALFDFLGNGIVYDYNGNVRLKYNQSEGVIVDPKIGAPSRWKWHTLNEPPVLQQVYANSRLPIPDPNIEKLGIDDVVRPDDSFVKQAQVDMLQVELDNFVKEKSQKLMQQFKPFQIKMKAAKLNEQFALKILDQSNISLMFRDGRTSLKLNLGMNLNNHEIIDTDISDATDVSTPYDKFPAKTESITNIQSILHFIKKANKPKRLSFENITETSRMS